MKYHTILVFFSLVIGCNSVNFRVKNFGLSKCSPKAQLVELYNVRVATDSNNNFVLSGTMKSQVDIESPVRVAIELKRFFLGLWIWIGCINNVGSCVYNDVCNYGLPDSESCPKYLDDNNVPCRCPISKGNYTIPTTFTVRREKIKWNINNGRYKGNINIKHNDQKLGCYDIKFTLY